MPNNQIILPSTFGDGTPEDPLFNQLRFLFRADKGLVDLTGHGLFDTKTAPLTSTYSKWGTPTLEFDGTNAKRFESSTSTGGQLTDTGWTIDAWVWIGPTGQGDRGIVSNQPVGDGGSFLFYITNANKLAIFNNLARATSAGTLAANSFHHVGVTKNGQDTATLWLDGQPENFLGNWTGNYASIVGLAIGGRLGGTVMYKGGIDSVRITQGIRWTAPFVPEQFPTH